MSDWARVFAIKRLSIISAVKSQSTQNNSRQVKKKAFFFISKLHV